MEKASGTYQLPFLGEQPTEGAIPLAKVVVVFPYLDLLDFICVAAMPPVFFLLLVFTLVSEAFGFRVSSRLEDALFQKAFVLSVIRDNHVVQDPYVEEITASG